MICICGHSDDLHEQKDGSFEELVLLECLACVCNKFCEDIDGDELEAE